MDSTAVCIVGLISITIMFVIFSILNSLAQTQVQRTLRIALEKGAPLSTELVAQMNTQRVSRNTDLRRGVVIVSIGIAALAAGVITGYPTNFATMGVFPLFMGVGFIVVWLVERRERPA